jgi:hypothetical protein
MNRVCKSCACKKQKAYSENHPGLINKRARSRYYENSEAGKLKSREWRKRNSDKMSANYKKWRDSRDRFEVALKQSHIASIAGGYKPCSATVEEIREAFTGKCYICGVMESDCNKKLCLDHCHETGAMRGWLCHKHNAMLGFANESVDILEIACEYLNNAKTKTINEANA